MTANDEIIGMIKATATKYVADAKVMLFGSRARNESGKYSDYDILIITKKQLSAEDKISLRTEVRKDLLKQNIRSDILIQSHKEIERKKELPGHLIRHVLKEAILL